MTEDTTTRDRILHTASELFQRQGYHATGLNQVLTEGGAPKGSLYFHFPRGKEQLGAEAVASGGARLADRLASVGPDLTDPADWVAEVVGALGKGLLDSDFRAGCPVATVALDVASDSAPIRAACDDVYRSWTDLLANRLARFGVPAEAAESLATMMIAAVEGGLLLARVRRDLAPLHEVSTHLTALIALAGGRPANRS